MPPPRLKRSNTSGQAPASLEDGEIAVNQADGKLYYHTAAGGVSLFTGGTSDGSVTTAKIADGSVTSAKLADGAVTTVDIAGSAVTYAKIQNVSATDRLLGRSTAGAGIIEEIVCTVFGRSILDDVDAAATRTTLGLGTAATSASSSFAASSHTHAATDIVSGTLADARLSSNIVLTTDSRLSDARTPTSHTHGNLTNAGAIGTTSGLPIITTTSGVLAAGAFGTSAGSFCQGNDARLSDSRAPTAHTHPLSALTQSGATSGQVAAWNGTVWAAAAVAVPDGTKGDITVSGSTWTINSNSVSTDNIAGSAVTYAKIQNVSATDKILGRSSSGAGVVEEISCTAAGRALIDDADATTQRTTLGLGSISTQASSAVAVTGGSINGTTIGATTASTGAFTSLSATGVIAASSGSASAPSITLAADTNTGLYSPGTDQFAVTTAGTQRLAVSAAGDVGIGISPTANVRLLSYHTVSNYNGSVCHQSIADPVSTANGSHASWASYCAVRPDVAVGVTNTGAARGVYASVLRNNKGASGTDGGTLSYLRSTEIVYGHASANTALTPTTTEIMGLCLQPYNGYGTVTSMYDLYIAPDATSQGTITNRWAIYQANAASRVFFAGDVGVGRNNPGARLHVYTVTAEDTAAILQGPAGGIITVDSEGSGYNYYDAVQHTFRTANGGRRTFTVNDRAIAIGNSEAYALGAKYSLAGGVVYFGATSASATPDAQISNAGGAALMTLQNDGDIGIGVTTPLAKLDVRRAHSYALFCDSYYITASFGPREVNDGYCTTTYSWSAVNTGNHWQQDCSSGAWTVSRTASNVNGGVLFAILNSGNVGIGTSAPTISSGAGIHCTGSTFRLGTSRTPASATATGNTGEICWDASYLYVCVNTNTWRRIAHSTW